MSGRRSSSATTITADQLRPFLRLSPQARQLMVDFVTVVARDEARRRAGQDEDA